MAEVRAMPYPEFRSWQIFYMLEPWGWENEEYLSAAQIATQYNINRGKGKPAKQPKEFMRDLRKMILAEVQKPALETLSREELIKIIKQDFGVK